MNRSPDLEVEIVRCWRANAKPWSDAVRRASIASRRLVTDKAILDAVSSVQPQRLFDVGCGEGWLARALTDSGIHVVGVDAVAEMIEAATSFNVGEFYIRDYAAIAARQFAQGSFDAAVCNFSLLGEASVETLIRGLPFYLTRRGWLIIQTLHPLAACGKEPYRDGWRAGSWRGFSDEFKEPAPWYFRTLQSWFAMLRRCGFEVVECREPTAPNASAPASVILMNRVRGKR